MEFSPMRAKALISDALARFEQIDGLKADLVKLRYFAGLTIPQAAEALGVSSATVDRYWAYARAWLHAELKKGDRNLGDSGKYSAITEDF
jgi:DNA-directed RNA polymerase specialized sigma24 family protein